MSHLKPNATANLATWLSYLEQLHPTTIDMGLARVKQVATKLDLLQPAPYIFTVAGTNGKGTTCKTLEMILLAAGFQVGVYSSPHLLRFTERVRINNQESTEKDTIKAFIAIEQGRDNISLSYFEYATLAALYQFKAAKVDVVILEVGLGGRLDATNIVDANIAVVTTIGIDHIDYLGDTRESIGREKAGIFKPNSIAVVGEPDVPKTIFETAQQVPCLLYTVNRDWSYEVTNKQWTFSGTNHHYSHLPIPTVPLANAATALAALSYSELNIPEAAITQGLNQANLTGRFQQLQDNPLIILDVAHNPHAANYLTEQINLIKQAQAKTKTGVIRVVIGMLKDKDIKTTLETLCGDVWYCASLGGERGCDAKILTTYLNDDGVTNVHSFNNVTEAFTQAKLDAKIDDIIIVCGSFHTVAEVLAQ